MVDDHVTLPECRAQCAGHLRFVFDQKNAHAGYSVAAHERGVSVRLAGGGRR
jgi:hypothetical protein